MTSFELSINFFKKILQFFMSDFLHSKYAKRRRICDMSRAVFIFKNPWRHKNSEIMTILIIEEVKSIKYDLKIFNEIFQKNSAIFYE